jgi:hypothetical protein
MPIFGRLCISCSGCLAPQSAICCLTGPHVRSSEWHDNVHCFVHKVDSCQPTKRGAEMMEDVNTLPVKKMKNDPLAPLWLNMPYKSQVRVSCEVCICML